MNTKIRKYIRLISESKYVFFINVSDRLFSFVIFLILARNFSYENYGEVITVFTVATIFSTILDLGFPAYLQRGISIDKLNSSAIFTNVFVIYLFNFLPFLILCFLTSHFIYSNIPINIFGVICIAMYISSLVNVCNKSLSGMFNFKSQFITFIISRSFIVIFFITGLYLIKFDLNSLLAVILIGFFLHLVLQLWFLDTNGINLKLRSFEIKFSKFIIKSTIPLGIAIIINFLYDKIDILLLSKILDFTKVAGYNIAYGLYKTSSLAFSFILVSGYSRVSFLSRNKKGVFLFLKKYFYILCVICVITAFILIIFSHFIIQLFYSSRYEESIPVLKVLSVGILAFGLNNLTGIILNGIGMYKTVMYITLFGLLVNVILNILFIPKFGIMAAAAITVITEYFVFFFEFYYLKKILNLSFVETT